MQHSTTFWSDAQQQKIYAQQWLPDGEVEAVVAIVHGMGELSDRYEHVAAFFVAKGMACIAYDHMGHGKSEGQRGHTDSYEHLLDGIEKLLSEAKKLASGKPIFLYGHSMGGNLCANFALRRSPQITGLILSAPWFELAFSPPSFQLKLAWLMNKIYPRYTENSALDGNKLTHDKAIATAYNENPLVHGKISTRFFFDVHEAGKFALENASKLSIPTLHMHGTADVTTSYQASQKFAEKAPKNLMTFEAYEGWLHELHNEPERAELFDNIYQWMGQFL